MKSARKFLTELAGSARRMDDGAPHVERVLSETDEDWMRCALITTWMMSCVPARSFRFIYERILQKYCSIDAVYVMGPLFGPIPLPLRVLEGNIVKIVSHRPKGTWTLYLNLPSSSPLFSCDGKEEILKALLENASSCCEAGAHYESEMIELTWTSPKTLPVRISPAQNIPRLSLPYFPIWWRMAKDIIGANFRRGWRPQKRRSRDIA